MQLTAKLIQLLPLQTGTGKNGQWKKQDIIVETEGQYPKKVCISIWGDKMNESQLQVGWQLSISFDVESREYNGKWYTDVKAWKIDAAGAAKIDSSGNDCLLYTSDAADERSSVDLGGRRIIKKKKKLDHTELSRVQIKTEIHTDIYYMMYASQNARDKSLHSPNKNTI